MADHLQTPFDVGIVMVTTVRPTIVQAIRSVFAQRFDGRIQILIGIDRWDGERAIVDQLARESPSHIAVTTLDLGYSTSQRNGGLYPSSYGGALRTILSYAANSRHVTYLDDDNFYAPEHIASMLAAIAGNSWAFALRYFVDAKSDRILCADTWESVGPGRGVYRTAHGGFVDANCFFIDKLACHDVFPEWPMTRYPGGTGGDRQVFEKLRDRPWGTNRAATVFYRIRLAGQHPYQLWQFKRAGIDLATLMDTADIPNDAVWQRCADFDREHAGAAADATTVRGVA
ncbi:MAG: glycosyltransferase [Betaproteobacteria bacterium]